MPQALPPNLRLLRKAFHSLEAGLDKIGPDVPLMGSTMAPEHLFSADLYREPLRPGPKDKSVELRHVETRSMLIRRRFGEMKQRSTTKNPICYRCGSPGHFATACRNAQKCLVCKGHGHNSSICTAQPFRLPHSPKPPLQSPPLVITPPGAMAERSYPIGVFNATMESEARLAEFSRSFILSDVAQWGADRVEQTIRSVFSNIPWQVSLFDDFKYLVQAPTLDWAQSLTRNGVLRLDGVKFPVILWDP